MNINCVFTSTSLFFVKFQPGPLDFFLFHRYHASSLTIALEDINFLLFVGHGLKSNIEMNPPPVTLVYRHLFGKERQ